MVVADDLSGQVPAPRRWEYSWTTANPADGTRPYAFGYADTSLSTEQLRRQFVEALARQDPVFSVSAPVHARQILEALSPGMHERLWAYGEGDFDIGYLLAGDTIVEVQDTMYTFALEEYRRVSANGAAARPAASNPDSSASDSRVEVADGSVLAGEIQGGKAAFKSAFGEINVSLKDVESFSEGQLRLSGGTVLKGNFAGGQISVITSLGTLEVAAKDVRAIERTKSSVSEEDLVLGAGQGLLSEGVIDNFGAPVAGATVQISGTTFRATTQVDGSYAIPYVPGTITVEIATEGYDPTSFSLNLAQASQYPVEQKRPLRLPARQGVFYWDKSGWQGLRECTSEYVQRTRPVYGEYELRHRIVGEPLRIAEHPWSPIAGGNMLLLDHSPAGGNLRIYRVDSDDEIVTDIQGEGIGLMAKGRKFDGSKEGTFAVNFQKLQLYPGRVFYAAKFPPGGYAVLDSSYKRLCFIFQIGDAPRTHSKSRGDATGSMQALQVEGKTARYGSSSATPNEPIFHFVSDGYRNTYALDCERRQFRWIENVRVSTGRVTGNSQGSDWRPMSPRSTISNAVYDAVCPGLIGDGPRQEKTKDAEVTGGTCDCFCESEL